MEPVGILIGLIGGAGATVVAQRFFIKSKSQEIIKNAEIEAENIRKERALQSKEKFLKTNLNNIQKSNNSSNSINIEIENNFLLL